MNFEKMANTISGGVDFIFCESQCSDEVKKIQAAEQVMHELVNTLKEYGIESVSELKDVFEVLLSNATYASEIGGRI